MCISPEKIENLISKTSCCLEGRRWVLISEEQKKKSKKCNLYPISKVNHLILLDTFLTRFTEGKGKKQFSASLPTLFAVSVSKTLGCRPSLLQENIICPFPKRSMKPRQCLSSFQFLRLCSKQSAFRLQEITRMR